MAGTTALPDSVIVAELSTPSVGAVRYETEDYAYAVLAGGAE